MHISAAAVGLASLSSFSGASTIITSYTTFGQPGNQAVQPANSPVAGVTGLDMTRSGVNPFGAANSFSANGWTNGTDSYFSFGFTVDAGFAVNLDRFFMGTRSSGTGPGELGLFYSGDNFASSLFSFTQSGTNFTNSDVDLSALTGLTGEVEFRIAPTSTVSANGGTIAATGTFRIGDYFDGSFSEVRFTGEVIETVVIPLPGAAGLGLAGLGLVAVRRRRA